MSPIFMTSLSPVCGFDVFTSPSPHEIWSTRVQNPRAAIEMVGTWKPGVSQHVDRTHCALPAQPGTPAQAAFGLPHTMQA